MEEPKRIAFERWLTEFEKVLPDGSTSLGKGRYVPPAAPEHRILQHADRELRRLARIDAARRVAFLRERGMELRRAMGKNAKPVWSTPVVPAESE